MGELKEKKEDEKKQVKDEKKEDEKKEEEPQEIVLKVDMHCEACARKVARALKGFEGVEDVSTNSKASKVVVKGKTADPIKICERLQKKSGRKVELISPLPKPAEEAEPPKEEKKEEKEEKKEEPPAAVTVVLNVRMHCEACAQVLQKRVRKIKGVESVETDVGNDQVIVKGVVNPTKLVEYVYKKTRKQVSIVNGEEKKDEEKKDEEKKDEEKKEEKKEEEKEGEDNEGKESEEDRKSDIKRSEYYPSKYYADFAYSPQFFSDENPNACSLM